MSGERQEALDWFRDWMDIQLEANDDKGGWNTPTHYSDPMWLLGRLRQEADELEEALGSGSNWVGLDNRERILREAADVANFAMMIADVVDTWGERAQTVPRGNDRKEQG